MGKCDSTNLTGRLFYIWLHNHNEILYTYFQRSISVSKFSHVIWPILVLSCHSYSCLVHLASHNVKEPWTRRCLQQQVSTENTKQCLFYHLPHAKQLYNIFSTLVRFVFGMNSWFLLLACSPWTSESVWNCLDYL